VYDGSDITKTYTWEMEGLAHVRDVSRSQGEKTVIGKGYSWFLSYLETNSEIEAVDLTMQGYRNCCWIEEFHRRIKPVKGPVLNPAIDGLLTGKISL